jgi:hypothetical protein
MIRKFENYNILTESLDGSMKVELSGYGWNCNFRNDLGKGKALLFDNENTKYRSPIKLKEGELFLFGIDTQPSNKGIGRYFIRKIFEHFNLDKIYIPSDEKHPVWNKIATKTNITVEMGSKDSKIFTIEKNQL